MSDRIKVALVLIAISAAAFAWLFMSGSIALNNTQQPGSFDEPIDITLDYYEAWLDVHATTTDKSQLLLPEMPVLSLDLRAQLEEQLAQEGEIDPLMCTVNIPNKVVSKMVSETSESAEIMVYDRDSDETARAIVRLELTGNGWVIQGITCSRGDIAPEVEFTFDRTGNLLKDSLQAPRDNSVWHLVYERDGQTGNVIPLYFDEGSMCGDAVCVTTDFTEAQAVTVKGSMTEAGVAVELVEEN